MKSGRPSKENSKVNFISGAFHMGTDKSSKLEVTVLVISQTGVTVSKIYEERESTIRSNPRP